MSGNGTVEQWVEKPDSMLEYYVNSLINTSTTYGLATEACASMGGILASVLNEQIQIFLESIIPRTVTPEQSRFYWIGAEREATDNSIWRWQTNENLNYSNWNEGEGSVNSTMGEYCASIWSTGEYRWYDNHCDGNDYGYVCQRNAEEITTMPEITTTTTSSTTTTTTETESATTTLQTTTETTTGSQVIAAGFQGSIESVVVPVVAVVLALIGIIILGYICYRNRKRFEEELDITTDEAIPSTVLQIKEMNDQNSIEPAVSEGAEAQVTYSTIQRNNDNNTPPTDERLNETMPLSPAAHASTQQPNTCHIERPNRLSVFGNSTYGMVINENRKKKSNGRDSYMDIYSSPSKKGKNNLRKSRTKV